MSFGTSFLGVYHSLHNFFRTMLVLWYERVQSFLMACRSLGTLCYL